MITYKLDKQAKTEPPWTRGIFDVIDYILTNKNGKIQSNMFIATYTQA